MTRKKGLGYYRDVIFPDGNYWLYIPMVIFIVVISWVALWSVIGLWSCLLFMQELGKATFETGYELPYVIYGYLLNSVFPCLIYCNGIFLSLSAISDAFHIRERNRRERGEL